MSQPVKNMPDELLTENLLTEAQHEAIGFAYERDYALLSLPMGFGKTVVSLTALAELQAEGAVGKTVIACPARVRDLVWSKEHLKWEHLQELDITVFPDDSGSVVVTSFNQLKQCLNAADYEGLIVDELTKLKSAGGAWFKALRVKLPHFKWRLALTGTLASEGLTHLYAMAMVVDTGKAFGKRKDAFLQKYFTPIDFNQYKWEPRPGAAEQIAKAIRPFTFQITEDDQGRPPLAVAYTYIDMPGVAHEASVVMAKDAALELEGDVITAVNAAVVSGKLQQICSGFVYAEDNRAHHIHDAKLCALRNIASKTIRPIMIVYQFKEELQRLLAQYPEARVLGDGVSKSDALETERLWNLRQCPVLLVHPASAGHGLNFQYGGSHIVFMGPIWSRDQTDQVIARLWRRGQRDPVTVDVLVMRDSVEARVIIPRVQGKSDGAAQFSQYLAELVEQADDT